MAAIYNQILIQYLDTSGKRCTTFWSAVDQAAGGAAAYAALAAAAQDVSDAGVQAVQFQSTYIVGNTPTEGPYNTVLDRCQILSSIPATSKPLVLALVAPKQEIFLADHLTLDLSNADVLALQTLMMSLVGDTSGNPMGVFRRGRRAEAKGGS